MWGTGEMQHVMNPDMPWSEEIRAPSARQERLAASPKTLRLMLPVVAQQDVRDILPTIRVPTLVLHHTDNEIIPPEQGRYIADHVQSAKYVEHAGRDMYHFVEPSARRCVDEISEFLTGERAPLDDDRVLATVLFTDIVDSTRRAAEMGDHDWKGLLDAHDAVVRAQLARFRGREVNTSGDSFLATFDGPQHAIRCAMSIRDAVLPLGLEVRAGLHSGECELRGDDIGGIAVHIAHTSATWPGQAKSWSPAHSATSSSAPDSNSTNAECTNSRACQVTRTSSPSRPLNARTRRGAPIDPPRPARTPSTSRGDSTRTDCSGVILREPGAAQNHVGDVPYSRPIFPFQGCHLSPAPRRSRTRGSATGDPLRGRVERSSGSGWLGHR